MAWLEGYPREKIHWGPTIDHEKCVGCGMCMNCGRKVYEWHNNKAIVARQDDCVVGCNTCANMCLGNAIDFPDIQNIRDVYLENNIWAKVKESLINKKIIK